MRITRVDLNISHDDLNISHDDLNISHDDLRNLKATSGSRNLKATWDPGLRAHE